MVELDFLENTTPTGDIPDIDIVYYLINSISTSTNYFDTSGGPGKNMGYWGINGWYYGNWDLKIKGLRDKFFGGVGLRRGPPPTEIAAGDSLDFWQIFFGS